MVTQVGNNYFFYHMIGMNTTLAFSKVKQALIVLNQNTGKIIREKPVDQDMTIKEFTETGRNLFNKTISHFN
jgi:hypothetical protein